MAKALKPNVTKRKKDGEATKKAAAAKKAATETMAEAWVRIMNMKNSPAETEKLVQVKAEMDAGTLGREAESAGKKFSKAEAIRLHAVLKERYRAEILRKMADEVPENYWLITTKAKFLEFLAIIRVENDIVFDVETTGTDIHKDYIVGQVLTAVKANIHAYIPTKHETDAQQLDHNWVLEQLRPIYENPFVLKTAHNAKFDIHMLANEGVTVAGKIWDTQVAAHVLNENEPSFALKNLVTHYLKIPSQTYEDLFGNNGFHVVSDLTVALAYAAKDGDVTRKLRDFQIFHMKRTGVFEYYTKVEMPLLPVVVRMERAGFLLDPVMAGKLAKEQATRLDELDVELRERFGVGRDFNFSSSPQLQDLLFNQLGLDMHLIGIDVKKDDKGNYSTEAKTLKILAEFHDGVDFLLEYRKASKSFGTYFDGVPKRVQPDGYVYGTFKQDATDTGRFSASEPNFQNIPPEAKPMFVAPPGQVILSGDFSQQEPRILTSASQEPYLLELYRNGEDLYSNAAAKLFNKPLEECLDGSKYRKMMKTGMLAVMYGTGPKTLSNQLGITVDEAKKFLEDFYKTYTKVGKFLKSLENDAKRKGFIRMLGGRKRRLPNANSRIYKEKSYAERQAKNSYVQGSAAIQTKMTMIAIDEWCRERTETTGKSYQIAFSIHDEIGVYVPEDISREEVAEFERIMLETVVLDVPNKTDLELSLRWGNGVGVEEWFAQKVS